MVANASDESDPFWTSRGRPGAGYFTKRSAEAWLADVLDEAWRGTLAEMVVTGTTFADAAAEYLRWVEQDRELKPSTMRDCRSIVRVHLLPAFGSLAVEDVTGEAVERFAVALAGRDRMTNRTRLKILTVLHGVMRRAQRVAAVAGTWGRSCLSKRSEVQSPLTYGAGVEPSSTTMTSNCSRGRVCAQPSSASPDRSVDCASGPRP